VNIKDLAAFLGLRLEELTQQQRASLQNECDKQKFIKLLREQGFVRARWNGKEITQEDVIE